MHRVKTVLICVMSIDGRIARAGGDEINWATPEDRRFFARETRRMGVVVMGRTTFECIGRTLPGRLNVVLTRSRAGRLDIPGTLEFWDKDPAALLATLAQRGFAEAAIIGGGEVNAAFLRAGLVDEIWLSIVPRILGGGVSLVGTGGFEADLELLSSEMLGAQTALLRYRVLASSGPAREEKGGEQGAIPGGAHDRGLCRGGGAPGPCPDR